MLTFRPSDFTERQNYKMLIGSIVPRPIAFVTTQSQSGVLNAAPFSFFNVVSASPPMISIAIQRKDGMPKDSAANILTMKEFVVHIVDGDNIHGVNETAATLAPEENELLRTDFTLATSKAVRVPGVRESKIRFECILENHLELGGNTISTDLIIGKIVCYHVDEAIFEDGKIDPRGLAAVSRLAGNDYAQIGDIFSIQRPK